MCILTWSRVADHFFISSFPSSPQLPAVASEPLGPKKAPRLPSSKGTLNLLRSHPPAPVVTPSQFSPTKAKRTLPYLTYSTYTRPHLTSLHLTPILILHPGFLSQLLPATTFLLLPLSLYYCSILPLRRSAFRQWHCEADKSQQSHVSPSRVSAYRQNPGRSRRKDSMNGIGTSRSKKEKGLPFRDPPQTQIPPPLSLVQPPWWE